MSIETDVRAKKNEQAIGHIKKRLDTLESEDDDFENESIADPLEGFSKELQGILELMAHSLKGANACIKVLEARIDKLETAKPRVIHKRAKRKKRVKKKAA